MLTYRTGAAGVPSAARNMGEHLLQQTLPPEMAAMAEYYEEGAPPPTAADAARGRYGHRTAGGLLAAADLEAVLADEIERLRDNAVSGSGADDDALAYRAMGALLAANLTSTASAQAALRQRLSTFAVAKLDVAVTEARTGRDYSSAIATPRRDMNPALAELLGIDPAKSLTPGEIAFLLNGQRADGGVIAGKRKQAATEPLRVVFGLSRNRLPTPAELEHVLAGRKANGEALPSDQAERAVRRFQAAFGVDRELLTPEERSHLLAGRGADGRTLTVRQYQKRLGISKTRIGYVDLTFSAPKSVSIAWAFAPTEAERAIIRQAHRDAIDSTMLEVERFLGRARKGAGGKDGWEPGDIAWVSFDHYAARPTVEVVRTTDDGESYTELYTLKAGGARVAGDMQLHTHNAVFNVALTRNGRVGGLYMAQLEGRVKEWGALYQAFLASNLRRSGVVVDLERRTEMAHLPDVPRSVVRQFSKRTLGGTAAARAYAASQGLDWDGLSPERKIALLKAGVQDPRGAKGDDVSDMEAWRRTAESIGYTHKSVLRADPARPIADAKLRRDIAYDAAMPLLTKQFARRAVIAGSDVRTAAAKGFIAAGIGTASEVSRLTLAFRQRGILQDGQPTKLIWGEIRNHQGQEKIAVTTALHEQEERLLIARAKEAGADRTASLTPEQIEAAIHRLPDLDFATEQGKAQRRIIDHLGQSGKLAVAIGVAGSGKSTLLRPLVQAWQADGRAVHGIALSWRQTDDLQEAGISKENRRAVEPFVRALASGKLQLNARAVVVVDEIGLLGTRQVNELMRARAAQNFTLVAIGDPKQMQAVEAGPVLDLLERALGTDNIPVLASSVRQRDPIERETVLMFRDGQTQEAVERKASNGTLRIVPGGYEEAVGAIVALWEERRSRNRERPDYTISLSAPTNFDAHAVSAEIRKRRRELGEVGDDKITVQASDVGWPAPRLFDLPLAIGDRVRLFRQTNAAGEGKNLGFALGRNGSVLEVADIADAGLRLRAASGIIGYVPWNNLRDSESGRILLDYGEVLTTNTAQGQTVTDHIHAMPGGTKLVSGFGAYTSGSRHREQSFIVVSDGAERAEISGRRPLGDRREIVVEDVLANIVRNFSRQPEKDSSLALIARAKRLRRGAIRGLQGGAQTLQREGKSDQGSVFARRLAEGRVREALRDRLEAWRTQFKGRASDIAAAAHNLRQMAQRLAAALAQQSKFCNRNWQDVAKAGRHSVSKESENIRPRRGPGMKL